MLQATTRPPSSALSSHPVTRTQAQNLAQAHNTGPAQRPSEAGNASQPAPRYRGAGLILILTAAFMVVLDFSIVNVALPSIQRELHFPAAAVEWVVTGYAIAFGGLLILGGRAADLFGRHRLFVAGLLLFSAASLAGGLAQDPVLLVAARVVQGTGAAIVAPAALSLITTGFPEGPQRTRALGLYGATSSIGFVTGQVLGGVLVQYASWRAVFLVNVPVGVAAAIAAPFLLGRAGTGRVRRRLDVTGALLITGAVAAVVFAVSRGNTLGWASPVVGGALLVAIAAAVGFLAVEAHHPDPLIRIGLLRRPGVRRAYSLILLLGVYNGGEMLVLSLYFQQVLHDSPLMAGLAIAPQGVVGFTAGMFGARLSSRLGLRRMLVLTNLAATVGFLVLTQLPATGRYSPLLAAVMFIGFGSAGTAFGALVSASRGVADQDQGVVGGVINTGRQIGAAVGAAMLPAIAIAVSHHGSAPSASGDRAAMLAGAVTGALATVVAWRTRIAAVPSGAGRKSPGR